MADQVQQAAEDIVSVEFAAGMDFEAMDIDIDEARESWRSHWPSLAVALSLLGKSPDGCRDMIQAAEKIEDETTRSAVLDHLTSLHKTADWLRLTATLVDNGQARVLVGMCRLEKERGGSSED